ncbi:MAG: TIGR02186 family protein [Dichotomicrobium sp.]
MARMILAFLVVVLAAASSAAAQPGGFSERIEADVSSRQIGIESDFAGIQVVVFGAVDNSQQRSAEHNFYDIAIVIRGPNEPTVVREKDRVFGVWVNQAAKTFTEVPQYYATLSTRPLNEIAPEEILAEHNIGYENLEFSRVGGGETDAASRQAFRDALIRIKEQQNLYQQRAFAVAFISRSLFRATVSLPANVPVGVFDVEIFLFQNGELLDTHQTDLRIEKQGLERFIFNLAYEHSLIYGLAGVLIAIIAGLAASAAFRKN